MAVRVFRVHLAPDGGRDRRIRTVGDALMESGIGLYKAELITKRGPWKTLATWNWSLRTQPESTGQKDRVSRLKIIKVPSELG